MTVNLFTAMFAWAIVVVTQTLDWKLHAFDVLSEFDGNNEASTGPMLQYEWLVGSQYKPMELLKSDWKAIRKSPPWSVDSWGLGLFLRLWHTISTPAFGSPAIDTVVRHRIQFSLADCHIQAKKRIDCWIR